MLWDRKKGRSIRRRRRIGVLWTHRSLSHHHNESDDKTTKTMLSHTLAFLLYVYIYARLFFFSFFFFNFFPPFNASSAAAQACTHDDEDDDWLSRKTLPGFFVTRTNARPPVNITIITYSTPHSVFFFFFINFSNEAKNVLFLCLIARNNPRQI